jgi:hypothetical protein
MTFLILFSPILSSLPSLTSTSLNNDRVTDTFSFHFCFIHYTNVLIINRLHMCTSNTTTTVVSCHDEEVDDGARAQVQFLLHSFSYTNLLIFSYCCTQQLRRRRRVSHYRRRPNSHDDDTSTLPPP